MNEAFLRGQTDWLNGIHDCPYTDYRRFDWKLGQERAARLAKAS